MNMKLKQLFVGIISLSLIFMSCTKEDTYTPNEQVTTQESTIKPMSTSPTVSSTVNKAYIFIETNSKSKIVGNYLLSLPKTSTNPITFTGFFGINGGSWTRTFQNYVDMPYWNNGTLPPIIESNISQTNGGVDSYGNPKIAYCFQTIKIPKNTGNEDAHISILIPVSQMNNDTMRQRTVQVYEKIGNSLVTNGSYSGPTHTMDSVYFSFLFNYQGNRIPKGLYRLYTSSMFKVKLTSTKDVYLYGKSAIKSN